MTDRSEIVKEACGQLLIERWFKARNNDVIALLRLLDVETYEKDVTIILRYILDKNVELKVDEPPYKSDLNYENIFYWITLIEYYNDKKSLKGRIFDIMPDTIEFIKLFTNKEYLSKEFMCKQLLKLSKYLNISDEYSRDELSKCAFNLLINNNMSQSLIPFTMKLLRKIHKNNEDEYIRLVCETINEVRDPIGDQNSKGIIYIIYL